MIVLGVNQCLSDYHLSLGQRWRYMVLPNTQNRANKLYDKLTHDLRCDILWHTI